MYENVKSIALSRYQAGERIKDLAEEYGFSVAAFHKWKKEAGIANTWGKGRAAHNKIIADDGEVWNLYQSGVSAQDLAKRYGCSIAAIYACIERVGSKPKRGIGSRQQNSAYRKYQFNQDFFEAIDTETKAYWLGFITADGSIRPNKPELRITLKESDRSHLEKFAKDIEYTGQIKTQKQGAGVTAAHINLSSEKLWRDLQKHGIVPQKSRNGNKFADIPKQLVQHYLRGLIDGDGCLSSAKPNGSRGRFIPQGVLSLVGCLQIVTGFSDFVSKNTGVANRNPKERKGCYIISYTGNRVTKTVADFLYKDATVYLDRKYAIYESWL